MNAFVTKGGKTPKVYVYDRHGVRHRRTLGTAEYPELAPAVEARVQQWRSDRRWDVLDAIIARLVTCCEAYRAELAGTLPTLLAQRTAEQSAKDEEAADVDLSPLVEKYVSDPKYRKQIRRFIPAGERFARSRFTRGRIAAFLDDLTCLSRFGPTDRPASPATRQRYKAALSAFAKALVRRDLLDRNIVQDVELPRQERNTDPVFLDLTDTWAVLNRLSGAQRALEALMAGAGMEWGACAALRRSDVNLKTRVLRARGTKNRYRNRFVEVKDDALWAVFRDYAKQFAGDARLFTMTESQALDAHQSACEAAGVRVTTNHQHRHGFAVRAIQAREDHQWIKRQLGHSPRSTLLYTTYGVYIDALDLGRTESEADERSDTKPDTSPRNDFKVEGR